VAWRRVPRGSYKPFLHHVTAGRPIPTRPVKLKAPRRLPGSLTPRGGHHDPGGVQRLRDRFLFALLAETGMRIGQALGLRHADFVSRRREVSIVPRGDNVNGARAKTRTITTLPVSAPLVRLYSDYMHTEFGDLDSDYVFVNLWAEPVGRPLRYQAVAKLVARLRATTGSCSPRICCAHARATELIRAGVPIEIVSKMLTHRSVCRRPCGPDRGPSAAAPVACGGRRRHRMPSSCGAARRHSWLAGLPPDANIYFDELLRRPRPAPRFIDEFVMAQLEDPANLATLPDVTTRHLVVLLIETGLRSSDALNLPFNPMLSDSAGWPCLRYYNAKIAEDQLIPLSPSAAETIRAQQAHLRDRSPDRDPTWLFPRPRGDPAEAKPFSYHTFRTVSRRGSRPSACTTRQARRCTSPRISSVTRWEPG
jgi:integrase